jgi:hypothetical protein
MKKSELRSLIREEITNILKEDSGPRAFNWAKPQSELKGNTSAIKKAGQELYQNLKSEKLNAYADAYLYFPNFTWADGKEKFGPSVAVKVSDIFYVQSLKGGKRMKVSDGLLGHMLWRGKKEAYVVEA